MVRGMVGVWTIGKLENFLAFNTSNPLVSVAFFGGFFVTILAIVVVIAIIIIYPLLPLDN